MSLAINASPINRTLIAGTVGVATVTVTPQMSGTTFVCTKRAAGGITVNLPDATIPGLWYKFTMDNVAVVATAITFTPVAGQLVRGYWAQVTGAKTFSASPSVFVSIALTATAISADSIVMISDGTGWYAQGETGVAAGIAFA